MGDSRSSQETRLNRIACSELPTNEGLDMGSGHFYLTGPIVEEVQDASGRLLRALRAMM